MGVLRDVATVATLSITDPIIKYYFLCRCNFHAVNPPSTLKIAPVMKFAASDAKK